MTEKWKLPMGREAFMQFINGLTASKLRKVRPGERDLPNPPSHQVSRREILDRFLATRPDLECFRAELLEVYSTQSEICVDTHKWNALVTAV